MNLDADLFDAARGPEPRRGLILETDGGARGNPGPAGYGAVVRDAVTKEVLAEHADYLGIVTNNVAEYTGLLEGLKAARQIDPEARVEVRADSKLVVEQMSGRWKIKHPDMQALAMQARKVFPPERVKYTWVPREKNKRADRLANEAMDSQARIERSGKVAQRSAGPAQAQVGGQSHVRSRPSGSRIRFDDAEALTVVLMRHGETAMTERREYSGALSPGPSLSPRGQKQAEHGAEVIASIGGTLFPDLLPVSKVLSSPLARALETAGIVGARLGMTVQEAPGFLEADFGRWEGLTPQQIENGWPGGIERWHSSATVQAPEGESLAHVGARTAAALKELASAFAGRTVVVCAHVVSIRASLGCVLGVDPEAWSRFRVAPGSVSVARLWVSGDGEVVASNLGGAERP